MAYLGNRKMSEISPNHPFAGGLRITFHLNERPDLPQGGSHGVEVSVSWGYELHTAKVSARKWKRIRSGEAVMVKSIGWYEGKSFECRWYFDPDAENSLVVSYGNDGADGFIGNILDATIEAMSKRSGT
jgi:creatinine amidohydrolase/Fe(II)-dependent formamide hydrolase-like protein